MTQPLIVDTDLLGTASASLAAAAAEIPVVPPPLSVSGSDPLSTAIGNGSVEIEAPMAALPAIKTDALTTAQNVGAAGQRYASTDEALAAKAARHDFGNSGSQGIGGGGSAASASGAPGAAGKAGGLGQMGGVGQMGGLGQMMGTPMQMAQQAGQIPAQLAQMAGSVPQSMMQGTQGAVQQVAQLAGQFGKTPDDGAQSEQSVSDRELIPGEEDPGERPADTGPGQQDA